jgi:predicted oxidoreductase
MKTYSILRTDLVVSRIAYGCAGLVGWDKEPVSAQDIAKATRLIHTAYDSGITLFDHANLYAFGKSEATFGQVLKQSPGLRDKIVIQSKCGQYFPEGSQLGDPVRVDLSRRHIVSSAEGSLERLSTDHLDILLLHLPDALAEPEEVAAAFDELNRSGKVRYFGVSNHTAAQIRLLKEYVRQPIVANQVHLGLAHSYLIADGLELTLEIVKGTTRDHGYTGVAGTGTLDYCRRHGIQVQAWSPLRGDLLNQPADAKPEIKQVAQRLAELAKQKDTTPSAVGLAWLLRHPFGIVPIIGATNPDHIIENCAADRVELSREEWYALFTAAAEIQSRFI